MHGYTDLARELTRIFGLSPPLRPQQVEQWYKRRTRNAAGDQFPEPGRELPKETRYGRRHRFEWETGPVAAWMEGGIPLQSQKGFRQLTRAE